MGWSLRGDEDLTPLQVAYSEHGQKMLKNIDHRQRIYDMMFKDSGFLKEEWELCIIYDPGCVEPTGVFRFFENHLWTHEPRPLVLRAYGKQFIGHPTLPFLLFDFQKEGVFKIIEAIESGKDLLIDKSRDMGVTWLVIGVLTWYWWRAESGSEFLLGSRKYEYVDKKDSVDTLFEKVRYNVYRLHTLMKPKKFDKHKNDNVGFIYNPDNENFFRGEANNPNFATSGRYKAIFADEFSKWEETDDLAWTSMGDSSPCRIAVSTPWGIGRKFAQLRFSGAIEPLTFHWSEHPIKSAGKHEGEHPYLRDKGMVWLSEWYLNECERRKDNPEANIGQELDIDYLSSGTPYFNNKIIQDKYLKFVETEAERFEFERTEDGIELVSNSNGRIWIREDEETGWENRYLISADVAEGLEKGDNSVMIVYDRVEGKDIAQFVGKIDTTLFAYLLSYFGYKYNNAYIACENNNHGHAVIQKLKEIYDNLYFEGDFSKIVDLEKQRVGWNTNVASRPIMCGELREAITQDKEGVIDKQFYQECLTFIYNKNGKAEADHGCLDDRVIAQAIKFQLHKWVSSPKENIEEKERVYDAPRFGGALVEPKPDRRTIWRQ